MNAPPIGRIDRHIPTEVVGAWVVVIAIDLLADTHPSLTGVVGAIVPVGARGIIGELDVLADPVDTDILGARVPVVALILPRRATTGLRWRWRTPDLHSAPGGWVLESRGIRG